MVLLVRFRAFSTVLPVDIKVISRAMIRVIEPSS